MEYESMTCDRCIDIHERQRLGTNNQPCRCDCHFTYGFGTASNSIQGDPNGTAQISGFIDFGNN